MKLKPQPNRITSCYKYDLPVVEYTVKIPENCSKIVIQMIGGGGSASYIDGKCIQGPNGAEILAIFDKPKQSYDIVFKLGLGGECQITKYSNCNSIDGKSSILKVNDQVIAIAEGSSNNVKTFENEYASFENVQNEEKFEKSCFDIGYYNLKDYDGIWGQGGKAREYENGGVYLGAGGHGACRVWIDHYYYYCRTCFKDFDTLIEYEKHELEH